MKSVVIPFMLGGAMALGACYLASNKTSVNNLMNKIKCCGDKIMSPFKGNTNSCSQSNCNC